MKHDVQLIIRRGVWTAFPELREMHRRWPDLRPDADRACGVRQLEHTLRGALTRWHRREPRDAEAMAVLLSLGNRGRRVLNGTHGLRMNAGRLFGDVGWDQFSRHYEGPLVERFADFLMLWEDEPVTIDASMTSLSYADVECTAAILHGAWSGSSSRIC